MGQATPYGTYRQTQVGTANQVRLIIMLHDGVIRFLHQTLVAMKKKDYFNQSASLNKALDVIFHLWGSLNVDENDEIAKNLRQLFKYMHTRLVQANVDDNPLPIEEAIDYFRTLREAWAQVDILNHSASVMSTEEVKELSKAA